MTNESRRAFDAEWLKYTPEDDKPMTKIIAEHFWRASKSYKQARILDLLESPELFNDIQYILKSSTVRGSHTHAVIEAIKQRIKQGE